MFCWECAGSRRQCESVIEQASEKGLGYGTPVSGAEFSLRACRASRSATTQLWDGVGVKDCGLNQYAIHNHLEGVTGTALWTSLGIPMNTVAL